MTIVDNDRLAELSEDEVVTHSFVKHVTTPSGGTLALITLDNGKDYKRPNTLGPRTLRELSGVLDTLKTEAAAGTIQGVAITGKEYCFAAGADLSQAAAVPSREAAHDLAALGHATLRKFSDLGVPSFAFVNTLALGVGSRSPCTAPTGRSRPRRRASGSPRCSSASSPAGAARRCSPPDRPGARAPRHRREPAQEQPPDGRSGRGRDRHR